MPINDHDPADGSDPTRSEPSRVTAVTAAVLATISGLLAAGTTIVSMIIIADVASDEPADNSDLPDFGPLVAGLFVAIGAIAGIVALLYLLGALLLFLRTTAGRVLVIIASTLGMALVLLVLGHDQSIGTVAAMSVYGTTLALAALPATGRWIAAKPKAVTSSKRSTGRR